MAKATTTILDLPVLKQRRVLIKVMGESSLITHPFEQKALKMIQAKQAKEAKSSKRRSLVWGAWIETKMTPAKPTPLLSRSLVWGAWIETPLRWVEISR